MYIAFFDSGLGGLNTLKVALAKMPGQNFIYDGDTAHVPYGPKDPDAVRGYLREAVDYLSGYGLRAFVIACNTATSAGAAFLRERYDFPILGMEPSVKPAVARVAGSGRRVLLLATDLTLKSEKVARLLDRLDRERVVDAVCGSVLVDLAERLQFDQAAAAGILREKLAGYDLESYGAVVLGSTHFNYFREAVTRLFPAWTEVMEGSEGTVNHLINTVGADPAPGGAPEARPAGAASPVSRQVLLRLTDSADQEKMRWAREMLERASGGPVTVI